MNQLQPVVSGKIINSQMLEAIESTINQYELNKKIDVGLRSAIYEKIHENVLVKFNSPYAGMFALVWKKRME